MSDLVEDIREALGGALAAIPGVSASGYGARRPPVPCVQVLRGQVDYDQAMGGGVHQLQMRVRALVADLSDVGASKNLDKYLAPTGDHSVKAAIEADTSLGGIVQDLHVTGATGEDSFQTADGSALLGSEWTVEIWL